MKSRKGFSLVEVIIALAILMIIANMLSMIFSFSTKSYVKFKKYNQRLDVVEYFSKNYLHNYNYVDIVNLISNNLQDNKLVLDSEVVKDDIYSLSMSEIIGRYKNNLSGDIEVTFALNNIKGEIHIIISCVSYGNTIKNYEIIKRSYES